MGLEFVESREGIKVTELNELFEKVCLQQGAEWVGLLGARQVSPTGLL